MTTRRMFYVWMGLIFTVSIFHVTYVLNSINKEELLLHPTLFNATYSQLNNISVPDKDLDLELVTTTSSTNLLTEMTTLSTTQPSNVATLSTSQSTNLATLSTSQPSNVATLSTSQSTNLATLSTSQPTNEVSLSTSQPTNEVSLSTTQLTNVAFSSTSLPTNVATLSTSQSTNVASLSMNQPTNEASLSTTLPTKVVVLSTKVARNIDMEDEWDLKNENIPELSIMAQKRKDGPKEYSSKCAKFPDLYTLRFSNIHWQIEDTGIETFFFYSAFLDVRGRPPKRPYDRALVRVLGMSNRLRLIDTTSKIKVCQFWFKNRKHPVFGDVTEVRMIWHAYWGKKVHYFPYLITCKLPAGLKILPVSVSLVPNMCTNATNNLNIIHRDRSIAKKSATLPRKLKFGVCVKALDFSDGSMRDRLIEWIETLLLLGADKIFFYEFYVSPEIKRALNYYQSRGIVKVTHITLPGVLPNQPQLRSLYINKKRVDKWVTELIHYNDCFLKNMYDYDYLAAMDVDEIIVPADNVSWSDLMNHIVETDIGLTKFKRRPVTTFCFQNVYFFHGLLNGTEGEVSDIAPNFHILRHIYRAVNSTGKAYMKCFHSGDWSLGLHNHFAFFCRDGSRCNKHYVDLKRAQMNHYRKTCSAGIKNCTKFSSSIIKDTKLWRFKDDIIKRVQTVLKYLV